LLFPETFSDADINDLFDFRDFSLLLLNLLHDLLFPLLLCLSFSLRLPSNSEYLLDLPPLSALFVLDEVLLVLQSAYSILEHPHLQLALLLLPQRFQHNYALRG